MTPIDSDPNDPTPQETDPTVDSQIPEHEFGDEADEADEDYEDEDEDDE